MWKAIRLTCLGIFLMIMDKNGINGFEDVKASSKEKEKLTKIMFKEERGRDITNLENEAGFNFTEAEMEKLKIWSGGVIPYYVDTLSFDGEYRVKLDLFLDSVSNTVGVQFLKLQRPPKDENSRWVLFLNRRGVLSSGGYTTRDFTSNGVQKVILGYDSAYNGELFETTLAILGVPPQHNAPNRDEHITVKYDNIMPDKKHLFDVLKNEEWLFHDLEYDFLSAGHYGLHKYSTGGFATIEPKRVFIDGIGDGRGFSFTDIWKIRMLYNYISKSRSELINKSDCLKMFKPGPRFNAFKPIETLGQRPRPKPNKYLGTPDDKDDERPDSDNSNFDLRERLKKGKPGKKTTTTKKPKEDKRTFKFEFSPEFEFHFEKDEE